MTDDYEAYRLSLDEVATHLRESGIRAVVLGTSGGTTTLYAGEPNTDLPKDDPCYYPVSLGPADDDRTGYPEEMSHGPTDDNAPGERIAEDATAEQVAAAIFEWFRIDA